MRRRGACPWSTRWTAPSGTFVCVEPLSRQERDQGLEDSAQLCCCMCVCCGSECREVCPEAQAYAHVLTSAPARTRIERTHQEFACLARMHAGYCMWRGLASARTLAGLCANGQQNAHRQAAVQQMHTHAHTHTHTHTRTHPCARARTLTHMHTHSCTLSRTHTRTHAHTHTHTHHAPPTHTHTGHD